LYSFGLTVSPLNLGRDKYSFLLAETNLIINIINSSFSSMTSAEDNPLILDDRDSNGGIYISITNSTPHSAIQ
jgi:hypothetical protein